MTSLHTVIRLAEEACAAALKSGRDKDSYAFRAFIRGQWQVIVGQTPALSVYKVTFLEKAGAL